MTLITPRCYITAVACSTLPEATTLIHSFADVQGADHKLSYLIRNYFSDSIDSTATENYERQQFFADAKGAKFVRSIMCQVR